METLLTIHICIKMKRYMIIIDTSKHDRDKLSCLNLNFRYRKYVILSRGCPLIKIYYVNNYNQSYFTYIFINNLKVKINSTQ